MSGTPDSPQIERGAPASPPPSRMTTYRHADGSTIGDEWSFAVDIETCEAEAEWGNEPIEYVEEVWVLESSRTFTLPTCSQCDKPAVFWGLCEPHAREDDPASFPPLVSEGGETQ